MVASAQLTRAEREDLRLRFLREFRGKGCVCVSVRRERATGVLFLSAGTCGDCAALPLTYGGLPVRRYSAPIAVHALRYAT